MSQSIVDLIYTAPLAGLGDSPFRLINRRFGAKHVYSEMVSVEGIWRKHKHTFDMIRILDGDLPLIVQLFGSKPESFSKAVAMIEDVGYIKEININAGCPVKKVLKSGSGAALMQKPELLGQIVAATRKATNKKLSVKLRSGKDADSINVVECSKICESEGAELIVVHPRTCVQVFSGCADWSLIKQVKESLKIPVTGNGDVLSLDDAKKMMSQTGCDSVMVGRGLVGNPWFFTGSKKVINEAFLETVLDHIELAKEFYGTAKGHSLMKKHLIYYAKNADMKGFNKKKYYDDICNARSMDKEIELVNDFFGKMINEK
ncbi:MAG: tRNA-dihydrouridine synthase family protein [Proteobacteria bacterium]|nr:tRNA-dihydrouridine synthase family protein [Pseudomonadota bacterium]